jgi:hypothetical protein
MKNTSNQKRKKKWPVVSHLQAVQRHYEECREEGTSHRAAEMFAFGSGPSLQTDTRWISGQDAGRQFAGDNRAEAMGSYYRNVAKSQGVNVDGAVYKSQLASYPGDPKAWVRSRADCRAVAAERGMTLEGSVNYKPPEQDTPNPLDEPYQVSEKIVDHEYEVLCDHEPDAAAMPAEEVKSEIREKLSPSDG